MKWEPPEGWGGLGGADLQPSDGAIFRAALKPHGPSRPLTCPHESILAVTVIDITFLLWKKRGGLWGSQLPGMGRSTDAPPSQGRCRTAGSKRRGVP